MKKDKKMNIERTLIQQSMRAQLYISKLATRSFFWLAFGLTIIANGSLNAQCDGKAMACNNLVHVSLDTNCVAVITPDVLLEDGDANDSLYRVEVRDPDGNLIDTIRQDYGGVLLETRVYCIASGIYCWGYIKIEDKIPPMINVTPCDTAVSCFVFPFDLEANSLVTSVTFSDNGCEKPDSLGITDVNETLFVCGDTVKIIERFWTVADAAGNRTTKKQTIYLLRGTLSDVTYPKDTIIDCLDEGDLSIEALGMPEIRGCDNFEVSHEDVTIEVCGVARKILRRWRVTDICTTDDTIVTQIIKIEDNHAPMFDFSEFELPVDRLSAQKLKCLADAHDIPNPIITDCNIDQTTLIAFYQLADDAGNLIGQRFAATVNNLETFDLSNVPIGSPFKIIFVADDGCGNISRDTSQIVRAIDTQPPNAICEGKTNVTLNQNGEAEVMATTFDDHSFDNCGIVKMQARRFSETVFRDKLTFTCDDVLNNPVRIVFRVMDEAGLFSDCIIEVFVQDKRPLTLTCLGDRAFHCDVTPEEIEAALLLEKPSVFPLDRCGLVALILDIPEFTISECGQASFTVVWTATDANGLTSTCSRLVTVGDMTPATVRRPSTSTFTLASCNDGREPADIPNSMPTILNEDCENIAITHEDEFFFGSQEACVKILRKWSIIDWCRFDGGNFASAIVDSFTQTIIITDNVAPVFVSETGDVIIPDTDKDCEERVTLVARATDDCTADVDLVYTYAVDMFDNGSTDKTGQSNDATGIYPVGKHRIIFMAEDMCGNLGQESFTFDVRSQKEPIVFLLNNSEVVLGSGGTATITAASLNASSSNGCLPAGVTSGDEGLIYSFDANGNDLTKTFTCSDIPNGRGELVETRVWVTDSIGNNESALITIIVSDTPDVDNPEGVCPDVIGSSVISGIINTESASVVSEVPVSAINLNSGEVQTVMTDEYGFYEFNNIKQYEDYEIKPDLEGFVLAGISTLDIVYIQRHILGLSDLNSPFKMVAADVNGSNSISASDLVELRQLILGRRLSLSTDEWKFIDRKYEFEMQDDPFYFENVIKINDAAEKELEHDFIALKVGDVSGNAFEVLAQSRSVNRFDVEAKKVGDIVRYSISTSEAQGLVGMQMAIVMEAGMEVVAIGSDQLPFNDDHFTLTKDELLISWSTGEIVKVSDQALLFIDVRINGTSIPILQLDNQLLQAEIYNGSLEEEDIAFIQNNIIDETVSLILEQNTPNPFGDITTISFTMARAGNADLTITDINGRTVYEQTGVYQIGKNKIDVSASDIPGSGIYYYTVTSGGERETRRMIVLH